MNFETTTCINYEHLAILQQYSEKFDISLQTLIVLLIRYAAEHDKSCFKSDRRIKYRERKGRYTWKRLHVILVPQEYEFIMDLKKVWKMSFALIIAFCVENVLSEFVEKVLESQNTDNYRICNYHFEFGEEEGIKFCHIYWGLPEKIIKKLLNLSTHSLIF